MKKKQFNSFDLAVDVRFESSEQTRLEIDDILFSLARNCEDLYMLLTYGDIY